MCNITNIGVILADLLGCAVVCYIVDMVNLAEIEAAIQKLPVLEVDELRIWLENHCQKQTPPPSLENWLQRARGAAQPGVKTDDIMALTRGEG
jgi:hypothetical protein